MKLCTTLCVAVQATTFVCRSMTAILNPVCRSMPALLKPNASQTPSSQEGVENSSSSSSNKPSLQSSDQSSSDSMSAGSNLPRRLRSPEEVELLDMFKDPSEVANLAIKDLRAGAAKYGLTIKGTAKSAFASAIATYLLTSTATSSELRMMRCLDAVP